MNPIWRNYWICVIIGILATIGNFLFSWGYTSGDLAIFALLSWIVLNQITNIHYSFLINSLTVTFSEILFLILVCVLSSFSPHPIFLTIVCQILHFSSFDK